MYFIFSKPNCVYCRAAKSLLDRKNINYVEVRVDQPEEGQEAMVESFLELGVKTVPYIVLHNEESGITGEVGGYEALETHIRESQNLDQPEEG